MPDVLMLAQDNDYCFELDKFFSERGFRFKFTYDNGLMEQWLGTLSFDLLLLPAAIPFEDQQRLAYSLWEKNPQAFLVLLDPEDHNNLSSRRVRLLGASLATGKRYVEVLSRICEKISAVPAIKKSEFKVLVVEDLDAARDIICSYIENLGYPKVSGVASAGEALKLVHSGAQIDCIITDERMPNISGHELVDTLRKEEATKNLPVIVLTAHGTEDCLHQSLRAGASGFLVKPPAKNDLLREMSRAIRIRAGLEKARLVSENFTN